MDAPPSKVAIITGATRGIGAAITERLAKDGFRVVLNYVANGGPADALVQKIELAGGRGLTVRADVSDPAGVRELFDVAEKAFDGVDVLVNNAGIMTMSTLADTDDAAFDRQIAVNLKGPFNTMREAARRLRRGGRIINLSSSVVELRPPTYAVYAATKAGVDVMTRILAKELRGREITVNSVAPGPTATELFFHGKTEQQVEYFRKLSPLERLGQPGDIAGVVSFLAGADGSWVNGQVLPANGGTV